MGLLSNPVFAKLEAWGYLWLLSLRGVGFTTNIFMNIALLKFGYGSVGCTPTGSDIGYNATMDRVQTIEEADLAGDECQGTLPLVGLPILSGYILLNTISTTMALLVTPIFGTIVDHSPSRKFHTFATCSVYVLVNAIAIAASPSNWFVMICLALFLQQGAYQFHVACVAAYCTEIADGDEQIIALQNAGRVRASERSGRASEAGARATRARERSERKSEASAREGKEGRAPPLARAREGKEGRAHPACSRKRREGWARPPACSREKEGKVARARSCKRERKEGAHSHARSC
jgi:hypothetical protein